MVVSDTTPEAGQLLAAEIRRQLSRGENGAAVVSGPMPPSTAPRIFCKRPPPGTWNGRSQAGNGDGQASTTSMPRAGDRLGRKRRAR
jgi:hypothetical protein